MTNKHFTAELCAFGTRTDWSTWTGVEIGKRIANFLNSKINPAFGDVSVSSSSSNNQLGYFFHRPNQSCRELFEQARCSISSTNLTDKEANNQFKTEITGGVGKFSTEVVTRIVSESMLEFYSYSEPPILLADYINRLINYTRNAISPVNLAVALFYIERIENKGACEVNKNSIYRLFAVAYLVAYKYMDDPPVMKNCEFCKIAGIPLSELNRLELSFLMAIDFELGVGEDISICQRITRILVPHKVSPEILIGDMMSGSLSSKALLDTSRWTPDSVIIDTDGCFVHQHQQQYNFDSDGYFDEKNVAREINEFDNVYEYNDDGIDNDDDDDDVFDRQSVFDNYSSVFRRNDSNRTKEEEGDEDMRHNFYEEDWPYESNYQNENFPTRQKDLDIWNGETTVKSTVGDKRCRELDGGNYINNFKNI